MSDAEFRAALQVALDVGRVVDEVAAAAPFSRIEQVLAAHRAAATPLTGSEIAEALAQHPRIGERPVGDGAAQDFSRREQAAADASDPVIAAAMLAGNGEYEARFDQVFLVRAAGRTRAEILAELQRRLTNSPDEEAEEVAEELRQIAARRLMQSLRSEEGDV